MFSNHKTTEWSRKYMNIYIFKPFLFHVRHLKQDWDRCTHKLCSSGKKIKRIHLLVQVSDFCRRCIDLSVWSETNQNLYAHRYVKDNYSNFKWCHKQCCRWLLRTKHFERSHVDEHNRVTYYAKQHNTRHCFFRALTNRHQDEYWMNSCKLPHISLF